MDMRLYLIKRVMKTDAQTSGCHIPTGVKNASGMCTSMSELFFCNMSVNNIVYDINIYEYPVSDHLLVSSHGVFVCTNL